jgi:ADP-L-glycero-D-manno-heptose 6-epimerase
MFSAGSPVQDWAERRILVTGGAGFIGSAIVWALNRGDCENIAIADFPPSGAKERNLAALRFRDYLPPDALLTKAASGWLRKFDFIFHMGACSSTTETNIDYLRRNNYEYTKTLAEAALASGTRFVYASSAATYGDGAAGMEDTGYENLERLKPLNPYGESKHAFDVHAWKAGWLDHIVGLKYFNVFGPNEGHKGDMRSVVHKSYEQVRESGTIRLFRSHRPDFADGEQRRDFIYVKDAVAMTLHLAQNRSAAGLFNIGSGVAHTWNELAHAVFSAMQVPARIEYVDIPEPIRARYQYSTVANIAKLRQMGYSDSITPLRDAVYDYVRAYLVPDRGLGSE